jgi:hypothetical protein
MISFRDRIEKNIFKSKNKDGLDIFHEVSFVLVKEFGWSYDDIAEAPIPFIFNILDELKKFHKKEEAVLKKRHK